MYSDSVINEDNLNCSLRHSCNM